ncbi:MAG: glycosyltransferase family 2 protein, partial [Cyclobacteriaceae bacterium]|nr:glycosyltransferase family 2 protein [Cyclobacteriaceae bacterium]
MGSSGFTIIIPAYNESDSIEKVVAEIKGLDGEYEIIVVDDGSVDGTYELAEKTGVKVLRHSCNKGYGASLKTGIKKAKYDQIVITDADGTYPIHEIPKLAGLMKKGFSMVVGARTGNDVAIPLFRRFPKWMLNKLANHLTGVKIPDINSGLRIMKKKDVLGFFNILPDGFSFTTTITLAMLTNDMQVQYVPINYYRRQGKSKIRPIYDTLNFIQLIIRTTLYFNPLKIFIPLSFLLVVVALLVLA